MINNHSLRILASSALLLLPSVAIAINPDTIIVYGVTPNGPPRYREWDGANWSAEANTLPINSKFRWVVAKRSPVSFDHMVAISDDDKDLNVMRFNGTSWGNLLTPTTDMGDTKHRCFDLAYDKSGRALLAFRHHDDKTVHYRFWNGSSWSAAAVIGSSTWLNAKPRYIKLAASPFTNEMILACIDDDKDLNVAVWDGSAFVSRLEIETDLEYDDSEVVDIAYEQASGRCMVVYMPQGTDLPAYRIWNGTSWSAKTSIAGPDKKARYLRLAASPFNNRLLLADLDDDKNIHLLAWNGASWGGYLRATANAMNKDKRCYDIEFEPGGNRAIAAYGKKDSNNVFFRVFDGVSWSGEQTGPSLGDEPEKVHLRKGTSGTDMLLAAQRKGDARLYGYRWDGSVFTGSQQLAVEVHTGNEAFEAFMLSRPPRNMVTVQRWRELRN